MTFSGAIAGLGAQRSPRRAASLNTGLSPGYGFVAIAVALVGNLEPIWIAVAAFAFGILQNGALSMQGRKRTYRPRYRQRPWRVFVIIRTRGTALRRVAAVDVSALVAALIALAGLTLIKATVR